MNPAGSPGEDNALTSRIVSRLRATGCVFAEEEAALLIQTATDPAELDRLVAARVQGRPLEHVLGFVDFGGLRLRVTERVFVPRQRTVALADRASGLARPGDLLLDLCCGVGAIAAVLADRVADLQILAVDIDPVATRCAQENLAGQDAQVFVGDLFTALPETHRGGIDLITANVPYVPSAAITTMPREARDHEPRVALDGGVDGLDLTRRVITGAATWLRPGGRLLTELSQAQAPSAVQFAARLGLSAESSRDDDREVTVLVVTRPPGPVTGVDGRVDGRVV